MLAVPGDGAHVPDHATSGVEIGGDDQQAPPAPVLGGDLGQELRRHALLDDALERPIVEQAVARDAILENIRRADGGEVFADLLVIARPEKGERRNKRADARSGDHRELGPLARFRPAIEQTRAERAVAAAG